jgi:pimeloyl-ACP methyl ester carboxylesterase
MLSLVAGIIEPGCHQIAVFPVPGYCLRAGTDRLWEPGCSVSTVNLLDRLGLKGLARQCPRDVFSFLENETDSLQPEPERLLALAELADQLGRMTVRDEALAWSRDAAVYAAFYLAEPESGRTTAATLCAAWNVHNRSVTRCLRLLQTRATPSWNDWPVRMAEAGILLTATVPEWMTLGFDILQIADEFTVVGVSPQGHRAGLGVPVMAHRRLEDAELAEWKPYGPRDAIFAATAVIHTRGSVMSWRSQPVELVLHDPLHEEILNVGGRSFPLAANLTPPLVHRLAQRQMHNHAYGGMVDPDSSSPRPGVYALDPYQPGKMPVVLVQGLWSSPAVWIPMLDSLRSDPVLRAGYQFWVVLYPSGYPLPLAALSVRRSLHEIRQRFDPQGIDPALNNVVILGKSTGGQVTRMLVEQSGESLWNAVFTRPIDQIHATPELRAELAEMFFFQPESYVRRVIFVTTAHRGSIRARQLGFRFSVELIRRNNPLRRAWAELEAANGKAVFQPSFQNRAPNSADGMEAENPLLTAVNVPPIAPEVVYHSIIANIHHKTVPEKISDGFVDYQSAHLEGATSECIVAASHVCEANPEVIAEVRRILMVHLGEACRTTRPPEQEAANGRNATLDHTFPGKPNRSNEARLSRSLTGTPGEQ